MIVLLLNWDPEHQQSQMCIVVVLSHGREGAVISRDNDGVSVASIIDKFNSSKCPALAGKPKLFIFQACRSVIIFIITSYQPPYFCACALIFLRLNISSMLFSFRKFFVILFSCPKSIAITDSHGTISIQNYKCCCL